MVRSSAQGRTPAACTPLSRTNQNLSSCTVNSLRVRTHAIHTNVYNSKTCKCVILQCVCTCLRSPPLSTEGAFTVIQRRKDGSVDFDLPWQSYEDGFGDFRSEYTFWNAGSSVTRKMWMELLGTMSRVSRSTMELFGFMSLALSDSSAFSTYWLVCTVPAKIPHWM